VTYTRIFFFSVLWLGLSFSSIVQSENIRFGFNSSISAPLLYQFENGSRPFATGGMIYEMSVAIGDELAEDYSFMRIPRQRIGVDLPANRLDLVCHNSPKWHLFSNEVQWSHEVYKYSNVLVSKKEISAHLNQIKNGKIAGVENFVYGSLEPLFVSGQLTRIDTASVHQGVKMLLSDRVDFVVMSDIEYIYHRNLHPALRRSQFVVDQIDIHCALSKKSTLTIEHLNKTIDQLKKKNIFQKIYDKYLSAYSQPKPFVYGLNNNDSPPFLMYDKNVEPPVVSSGLFIDMGIELGKRLQRPVEFAVLPRGRLDGKLAEGQVDVVCYNNENWAGDAAKEYHWSNPFFVQTNLVTYLKNAPGIVAPKTVKDLKGQRIGTVLNFVYPSLEKYFADKTLIREDAGSGLANLEKMQNQRLNYVIVNNLEFNYYRYRFPELHKAPFEFDKVDIKCATSKRSNLKIESVNQALVEMKKQGRLQKILFPNGH